MSQSSRLSGSGCETCCCCCILFSYTPCGADFQYCLTDLDLRPLCRRISLQIRAAMRLLLQSTQLLRRQPRRQKLRTHLSRRTYFATLELHSNQRYAIQSRCATPQCHSHSAADLMGSTGRHHCIRDPWSGSNILLSPLCSGIHGRVSHVTASLLRANDDADRPPGSSLLSVSWGG